MRTSTIAIPFVVPILAASSDICAAEASESARREVTIRREEGKTVAENAFLSIEFATADKKLRTVSRTASPE